MQKETVQCGRIVKFRGDLLKIAYGQHDVSTSPAADWYKADI
jgi:hypothetical protein